MVAAFWCRVNRAAGYWHLAIGLTATAEETTALPQAVQISQMAKGNDNSTRLKTVDLYTLIGGWGGKWGQKGLKFVLKKET